MTSRILIAIALMVSLGCASSSPQTGTMSDSGLSAEEMSELERLFQQRQQEALGRYTQAEVDFMTGMIGHHAQALIMSRLAPENGASSSIGILAARIINAQNDEIATMQRWLEKRGEPVPQVHIDGLNLMVHVPGQDMSGGHDHAMMPGMLTQAQLEELASAQGPDFDRLFLTYMIKHHEGATSMVDDMFAQNGAGNDEDAFRLATDINVDQETEIARMQLMLDAMTEN